MCIHEWVGAVVGYTPKKPSALLMSEFRPVACICTKFALLLSIVTERLDRVSEDYRLLDDTQEGFHWNRNTKRQLGRLRSILADQRRRKQSLSVFLYLDIKNAFNAVNHRAILHILEVKAFQRQTSPCFSVSTQVPFWSCLINLNEALYVCSAEACLKVLRPAPQPLP